MTTDLSMLAINTIRTLSIDAVQKANSGHPGLPLGAAPMAHVLWQNHLKHDPKAPHWFDRDRFVLSAGHGSMLLYSLLHLTGYDLSLDDIKAFRQWDSKTPGHPEWHFTPGVEATTGPLGQGAANAVGMAIAEKFLAHFFNREGHEVIDHHTYALVSDGDVMEGVCMEAASLAGHLKLGKLTYLYDANHVTLDGPLSLVMSEDVGARFAAMGWQVLHVPHGDTDLAGLDKAIRDGHADPARPTFIVINTTIGYGSPKKAGTSSAHGSPLGDAEVAATKQALGWDPNAKFLVPDEVRAHLAEQGKRGAAAHAKWREKLAAYKAAHPDLADKLEMAIKGELPAGWDKDLPSFSGKSVATRAAGGKVLTALGERIPWLFGGDADLGGSTKTIVPGGDFAHDATGRNLRFGIREHGMGAIANGMLYHGGIRPFTATFFTFSDYMRPSVRLAALNKQPSIFVWTHDSVGLGEDGPTHQPVETVSGLRVIPNLDVIRPADPEETAGAFAAALERTDGPTLLALTRQAVPMLNDIPANTRRNGVLKGGYVAVQETGPLTHILLAAGSELQWAVAAAKQLGAGVRVVSIPSFSRFDSQSKDYRDSVLPPSCRKRVAIEAGVSGLWYKYVGLDGKVVGIDRFGLSAPGGTVMKELGITAESVVAAAKSL